MRTAIIGFVTSLSLLVAAVPSLAADERNVTIVNATGYAIKFLGFNPPGDDEWNDNELSSPLKTGEKVYVKFNEADKGCKWNVKVDWANFDSGVLWKNVDLCKVETLTLKYDKATDVTSYTAE